MFLAAAAVPPMMAPTPPMAKVAPGTDLAICVAAVRATGGLLYGMVMPPFAIRFFLPFLS
jgi:hypothetical protein